MQKKQLKDLNLLDDFLFYTMTNHPLYGEKFSRLLLKIIFNREFGKSFTLSGKQHIRKRNK